MGELSQRLWLFGTLGQGLMDLTALGLLVVWKQDAPTATRGDHLRSALIGLGVAAALAGLRYVALGHVMGGRFMAGVPAFTQAWDGGWSGQLFSLLPLAVYGPGEALLVLTWLKAWDRVWGPTNRVISPGVIASAVLWSLPHLMNFPLQGWDAVANTATMLAVGLGFGALARATRSPWGSILFWTLANGTSV